MYGPNCIRGLSESVKPRRRYKERETIAECIWTFKFSNKCPHLPHPRCAQTACVLHSADLYKGTSASVHLDRYAIAFSWLYTHTGTGFVCYGLRPDRKVRLWFNFLASNVTSGLWRCGKYGVVVMLMVEGVVSRPQKCALHTFWDVRALVHAPTGTCYHLYCLPIL